ncbi:MAG: flagellar basal body P-ring protein FlgI [Deltaproteobacteria bacterium]|nr:flagellar basal body P-ring protein FlgI [Deltaproteobacteria bacterium]
MSTLVISLVALLLFAGNSNAARIKDIAFVEGVRANQLVGYGLVVGLGGTGDKSSSATTQSISNMLNRMGMKIEPKNIKVKNTASVLVTAEIPPFIKPGSKIDILVSSLGDASSLQGGTLISTPLRGPDGAVYAMAQGSVALAGFTAGAKGASVTKNHQTAGKIPGGAIIEKEVPFTLTAKDGFFLSLRNPDFTTARRMVSTINAELKDEAAAAVDAGKVRIIPPANYSGDMIGLISNIELMDIKTDSVTKVVVNERTGTVVMGENVSISSVAISHGDISIEVKTQYYISQPAPFSKGETVVQPVEETKVQEDRSRLIVLPESVTLGDVVRALNLVGVTPRDLVAILQAIKAAGALQAELEII